VSNGLFYFTNVYPGYAQPVSSTGRYWASQPVLDPAGRVVGYTGQPVQVCSGYVAPPARRLPVMRDRPTTLPPKYSDELGTFMALLQYSNDAH
jgi:hypothetical protein